MCVISLFTLVLERLYFVKISIKDFCSNDTNQIFICDTMTLLVSFVRSGVFREATTDFTVDARALTQKGGDRIKTLISNPSGSCTDALITDLGDGTYNVEYTPYEEGEF